MFLQPVNYGVMNRRKAKVGHALSAKGVWKRIHGGDESGVLDFYLHLLTNFLQANKKI
jgi:hypothetical protein